MQNTFSLKYFLYDWAGYNKIISEYIHSKFSSKPLLAFFEFITEIGNYKSFPVVFALLSIILFMQLKYNKKTALQQEVSYSKCLMLLALNFTISLCLVSVMKEFFHYTRPYCLKDSNLIKELLHTLIHRYLDACHRSFPSGHTAYITILVISLWKILNRELKIAGGLLIFLVGISRIIVGWHFMADVVYGFLLVLFIINPIALYAQAS